MHESKNPKENHELTKDDRKNQKNNSAFQRQIKKKQMIVYPFVPLVVALRSFTKEFSLSPTAFLTNNINNELIN